MLLPWSGQTTVGKAPQVKAAAAVLELFVPHKKAINAALVSFSTSN